MQNVMQATNILEKSAMSATAAEIPVSINDLTVAYREKPVLRDIDLTIPPGRLAVIMGPNGAGKSTLIKAVLDLVPAAAGQSLIFGKPYREQRKLVGYVPQRGSVDWDFPTTALDVVMMGTYGKLGWLKRPGKTERDWSMHCLEQIGMSDYANRQISQLSGGQQQRVFLARALAQDAKLYFMDEPFVGVDATTERAIVTLLQQLREQGKTVVCVHHDLESAADYFDWLVLLNVRLIATGPLATTFTEENLVKTYGGRMHALRVQTAAQQAQHVAG
jgi:manganese/zinc/iron transport system ATP- binding protein